MIKVSVKDNVLEVRGHANQSEYGTDIVCASVSTALIMTVNQIELFDLIKCINYTIDEGLCLIEVVEENEVVSKVLNNLKHTLFELEEQYSKYIKINKK